MQMKLTVLGSGSFISGPERAASGFALKLPKETIAVDLGFGSFKNMQRSGIDCAKVNNLFFTHVEHPDHINDLSAFLFVRKGLADSGFSEKNQVNIFGGPGLKEFIEKMFRLFPLFENLPFKVKVSELEPFGTKKFNGFTLTTKPMQHRPSSLGLKFEAGKKSVVFTGDTEPNENLVELSKNVDLLVAECTFATTEAGGHLNARTVSEIASRSKVKKLLLAHFEPEAEKSDLKALVSRSFKGEILLARDLMQVSI